MGIVPLLGEVPHRLSPALGHKPGKPNPQGFPACLTSTLVTQWPPPDEKPGGFSHLLVQEQGHRSLGQQPQDVSTSLLTRETRQLSLQQYPLEERRWASAREQTRRPENRLGE
jgi:hypothetical protein